MRNNPIICTSSYLRTTKSTASVAIAIKNALAELCIEHLELTHTNDYWCRDYMPILLFDDGSYASYTYNPDYLNEKETDRKYITNQQEACKDLQLFTPERMNVIFDGGNYVRCNGKVIMTDKILMENPNWPIEHLLQHIHDSLCADVILVPWDMNEPFGHADGMCANLGNDRLLLNHCWKKDPSFRKRLLRLLEPHFDVIELNIECPSNKYDWCYLNYLQVPGGILLPCLSEKADCDSDRAALKAFERLFPDLRIMPIYAFPLIEQGGALHCVTWEYYPHIYSSYPADCHKQ